MCIYINGMVANIPKKLHFNVLEKRIGKVERRYKYGRGIT